MEQAVIHSPLGPLTLFAEDDHLTALVYGDYGSYDDLPLFREAKRQLEAYFAGQRQAFSLPLNPDGTAFQRRVWQSLCDIPYGRVISYRELAAQVGSPRAFQAVGQANGRNPLPILIPCHRVIAADGTLGGYSSGVERKRFLLRLEGLSIPESKPPRRVGKRGGESPVRRCPTSRPAGLLSGERRLAGFPSEKPLSQAKRCLGQGFAVFEMERDRKETGAPLGINVCLSGGSPLVRLSALLAHHPGIRRMTRSKAPFSGQPYRPRL